MSALDTLVTILQTDNQFLFDLKYCLHINKTPYRFDGENARPNVKDDFSSLIDIFSSYEEGKIDLEKYSGLGISCGASNISAVDIDHCFTKKFDIESIDDRGKEILEMFKDFGYVEFSYSGEGMRILLPPMELSPNHSEIYYIKNSNNHVEFYNQEQNRYVTLTGRYIINNAPKQLSDELKETVSLFLNTFMLRPNTQKDILYESTDERSFDTLLKLVKNNLFENMGFQNAWYSNAPGSNSNESELDFYILCNIINVTTDREMVRQIFESSPYFKSKDEKHIKKWISSNYRYFNYMFNRIVTGV